MKACDDNRKRNATPPPKFNILGPARVCLRRAGRPYYIMASPAHISQHKDIETGKVYDIHHCAKLELVPEMREGTVFKAAEAMKIAEAWGGFPVEI